MELSPSSEAVESPVLLSPGGMESEQINLMRFGSYKKGPYSTVEAIYNCVKSRELGTSYRKDHHFLAAQSLKSAESASSLIFGRPTSSGK